MNSDEESLVGFIANNRLIHTQRLFLSLIIGFIAGLSFGYFLVISADPNYQQFLYRKSVQVENHKIEVEDYEPFQHEHIDENTTLSEQLYDEIKILCWIITEGKNHDWRGKAIKQTWGKKCNKLVFISTKDDLELGAIGFKGKIGQEHNLWGRVISGLKHLHENYLDEYDWFLKADDDIYVVIENVRYMLKPHSPETPIYFGSKYQATDAIYMAGGSGYVLSKEAIKRFVEIAIPSSLNNTKDFICDIRSVGFEDVELGKCLRSVGVIAGDSRDSELRTTFHPLSVTDHLMQMSRSAKEFFESHIYYKTGVGLNYSSDYGISFNYISPSAMYNYEYLIYHLNPYGIWSVPDKLPDVKYNIEDELRILEKSEEDRNIIDLDNIYDYVQKFLEIYLPQKD